MCDLHVVNVVSWFNSLERLLGNNKRNKNDNINIFQHFELMFVMMRHVSFKSFANKIDSVQQMLFLLQKQTKNVVVL